MAPRRRTHQAAPPHQRSSPPFSAAMGSTAAAAAAAAPSSPSLSSRPVRTKRQRRPCSTCCACAAADDDDRGQGQQQHHTTAANSASTSTQDQAVPSLAPSRPRRGYRSLAADVLRRAPAVDAPPPVARARVYTYYQDLRCEACGSGDDDDELILCDRCDRGHHTFCLRPVASKVPIGPWFCPVCAPPPTAPKSFPENRAKIFKFFGIQEDDEQDTQAARSRIFKDARKRKKSSTKKRRRILPFMPSEDQSRRLKQLASLATALRASKTVFSDELTYMPNMAPGSSNLTRLDVERMQVLHKEDKECIDLCKTMQKRGECPPLLLVFDSQKGFTVQADGDIKDMTFLAEYTGDVDYLENRENDDCDSIMTLLVSANRSQSLVICPDKRGNISRFLSGINNHTPDGKKKQNVKCVRYDIDGKSHALLVTCRDIACGEKLYYDYNGYENAYPTHHFL